jgi:hypothetical protein
VIYRRHTENAPGGANARTPAALLMAIVVLGCGDAGLPGILAGDEVSLGAATPRVDLAHCLNVDCRPEKSERQAIPGEERSCEPRLAEELELIRFRELVHESECPGGGSEAPAPTCTNSAGISGVGCDELVACWAAAGDVALAPDRTTWIAIDVNGTDPNADRPVSGVWVVHEAQDGSVLGARMLAMESRSGPRIANVNARLSMDERGHAWVLLRRSVGDELQGYIDWNHDVAVDYVLIELDEDGRELGTRIPIALRASTSHGLPEQQLMIASTERGLLLAEARFGSGSIGLLDLPSRTVRWVQTREQRLAIRDLVSDASGEITILTRSPNLDLSGRIERYTATGRLAWERVWKQLSPTTSALSGNMTIDASGTLRIAEQVDLPEAAVHRIAADGMSRSTTRLRAPQLLQNLISGGSTGGDSGAFSALTAQNSLLMSMGSLKLGDAPEVAVVYELSEDATACRLYTWAGPQGMFGTFRVDAARQLHFTTQQGYGVLQLPEAP